jgi:hypothetical protein
MSPIGEKEFGIRLTGELWEAIERERERLQALRPGSQVTTSDVIREVLWRAMLLSKPPPDGI